MYKIVKKQMLSDSIVLMDVKADRVAKSCYPGQFVIVKMDEKGERIPLTVCDYDREAGTVTIVFQAVGASTEKMAKLNEGDSFRDFVGPLGRESELVHQSEEELAKKNVKSIIIHVPELLRDLKDSFSSNYSDKFYRLKHTPLLLLDDIGAEYLTAWGRDEVIEPILQYRMDENLPTFFTSNFTLEELEKHFSVASNSVDKVKARRIMERIRQLSKEVELSSKNLR